MNYKSRFIFIWEEFEEGGFVYPNTKIPIKRLFQEADFDIKNLKVENKRLESQKAKLIQEKKDMRDEIESVRRENKKLREALGGIRNICCDCASNPHTGENTECFICKTLKELEGEK